MKVDLTFWYIELASSPGNTCASSYLINSIQLFMGANWQTADKNGTGIRKAFLTATTRKKNCAHRGAADIEKHRAKVIYFLSNNDKPQ